MPLYKRKPFITKPPPANLNPDEPVFFLKLTNEIFQDYDEYFQRVIMCNSLVWACSLTGRPGLTYEEALDSEKDAKRILTGFPRALKKGLLYLTNKTNRGRVLDVCEDVFAYAREHYFVGEEVLAVIGNLWCHSRVVRVIPPTPAEIEAYRKEQEAKGELEKDEYLSDNSWGPPPDLYRYEVEETDPDNPDANTPTILEAIDVKREKTLLTRDKCKYLIKLCSEYDENARAFRVKPEIWKGLGLDSVKFLDLFVGECPIFEATLGPAPSTSKRKKSSGESSGNKAGSSSKSVGSNGATSPSNKSTVKKATPTSPGKNNSTAKDKGPAANAKPKKPKAPKKLSPEELKRLELEKKAQEREELKAKKRMVLDFKKFWLKPKEDLEVEDLKDLPTPDPVVCKIPNQLFGEFMMVLEFFFCYSNTLKVRDSFPNGLGFDGLERALTKTEVAGPFSDILQILLRALFRLQETENAETTADHVTDAGLDIDDDGNDITAALAIEQATSAASWSLKYQNTPLHKLPLDHLSLTEILRLHLLASGAVPSDKDVKWRFQMRGGYTSRDDPGIQIRLEEPQILKSLSHGTLFDLTLYERLTVIKCLINQILTYVPVRDVIDESFEEYKHAKMSLRSMQAAEKRKETEDHVWRQKLKTDKVVPDENFMKAALKNQDEEDPENVKVKGPSKPVKAVEQLSDRQIEILLEKRDRETARRKQNYEYEVDKITEVVNKHERKLGIHPIGRDRAYRRYWIFSTLPGLFVEQDDEFVGSCLSEPTPYIENVDLDDLGFIKEQMARQVSGLGGPTAGSSGSDKENSTNPTPKKVSKKKSTSGKGKEEKPAPTVVRPPTFGICTTDIETCPVHSTLLPHSKWGFYWNVEQLDSLIAGLTVRGIREKELRNYLQEEKSGIESILQKCPVAKLNTENKYPESITAAAERRPPRTIGTRSAHSSVDPNLNFPSGTPLDTIMDLRLRDLILEFEEKVFLGALGHLRVKDRAIWRQAIENRSYDKQVDRLHWGTKSKGSVSVSSPEPCCSKTLKKEEPEDEENDEDDKSSVASSSSSVPVEGNVNQKIKELASAILQLEQSLEPKFLKKPLGSEIEDTKKKSKAKTQQTSNNAEGESSSNPNKIQGTSLERWEISLMTSTSFSQLFLHLFTLDDSVEWNRSVLNARCRVCRRKGDGENMLLCDTCNKGHHLYCLRPALDKIPKDSWYCQDCKPAELEIETRTHKRKTFSSIPLFSDTSSDEENEQQEESEDSDGPPCLESNVQEVCEVCQVGGEVICCDSCPRVYHLECLVPPKSRVPRGAWYCDECINPSKKKKQQQKAKEPSKKKEKKKSSSKPKSSSRKRSRRIYSDESEEEEEEEESEEETEEDEEEESLVNRAVERSSGGEEEEDEVEEEPVKVRFPRTPRKQRSSGYVTRQSEEREEDEEEDSDSIHNRHRKRSAACQAALKISQAAKRLRSDSKENESSNDSYSNSTDSTSSSGFRKRSLDRHDEGIGSEGPQVKRTRLQRMNTNQCGNSGDLDNVLLDRLISDVMKQSDAWPFLKPVTRAEAPDYHDIVKTPMDLGTIKYKLNSMAYTCNQEFLADLQLIFDNCFSYNPADNAIYQAGETLQNYVERRCKDAGLHFSGSAQQQASAE